MAKKKSKGYVAKPFCYYCERDFEDEKVLMQHQKAKHFKCRQCPRKLNTAGGLAVHVTQVHKTEPEKLENCIKGRDGYDVEIFGMEGVPADVVKEYHRRKVEETGIAPTEVKPPAAKRPKFSNKPISEVELHAQLAAHKALMSGVAPIPPPMTPVHGFPPPPGLGGAGSPFPPGGFPGGPPGGMPGMPPFMPPPGASGAPPPGAPVGFRPPFPPMPPGWQPGMPLPPFPPNNAFAPPPPAPGLYGPTPTLSSPAGAGAVGGTARSPMPPGGSPVPPGGQAPPFGFAPLPPGGFAPGQVPPPPPFGMPAPGAAGFSPHGAPGVPPPPPAPTAAAPASGSGGMVYSLTDLSPEERRAKHPRYAFQPAGLGPKQGAPPTATILAADEPVTMADASETVVEGGEATGTKTTSEEEDLLGKGRKRAAAADLF